MLVFSSGLLSTIPVFCGIGLVAFHALHFEPIESGQRLATADKVKQSDMHQEFLVERSELRTASPAVSGVLY
ncbi:MAG TPA: hypothetical protein VG826_16310 [Pirellulales bacterium]|nr:hypothetical protein [Pirellulales bacterium]